MHAVPGAAGGAHPPRVGGRSVIASSVKAAKPALARNVTA
jgi:hypothetical protein